MLSQQLRRLRQGANMSQRELAQKLFVSQQAVAKWERGDATPNPETVLKIAEIFDVSTDELLGKAAVESPPAELDELEKRVLSLFRQIPEAERDNMLLAVEVALRSRGLLE